MVHYLGEFQESEFAAASGVLVLIYLPCPRLAEGMGREVVHTHLILYAHVFQLLIDCLNGYGSTIAIQEART